MDLVPRDLGRRCVPYAEAWQTQREVHAAVADGRRPDTVLLVEHESVYTAGRVHALVLDEQHGVGPTAVRHGRVHLALGLPGLRVRHAAPSEVARDQVHAGTP